ncbi:MAG: matrixin family metalloprotease [Beijerinckiaceae bacterium]
MDNNNVGSYPFACSCALCSGEQSNGFSAEYLGVSNAPTPEAIGGTSAWTSLIYSDSTRWNNLAPIGTPTFVTFSFMDAVPSYDSGASRPGFVAMTAVQRDNVRSALQQWSSASGVVFLETNAGSGDIRFGQHNFTGTVNSNAGGYAYYANSFSSYSYGYGVQGDVYANTASYPGDSYAYSWGRNLILHEIGHAIGLKHPFSGTPLLDSNLDNSANTVMSYTGGPAQSPGYLDVLAVRYLYGTSNSLYHVWNKATSQLSIYGTSAAEAILGIEFADVLSGGAGADTVWGQSGADTIYGGDGNDVIYGMAASNFDDNGSNWLLGENGNDYIYGGLQADVINGGNFNMWYSGDDFVAGSGGNDSIWGEDGADTLYGESGRDVLLGGYGADYLNGGSGADTIYGEDGTDAIFGDVIGDRFGSTGDLLDGGAGNDYILAAKAGGSTVTGGDGDDVVSGDIYGTSIAGSASRLNGDGGNDYVIATSYGDILNGGSGIDVLWRYTPGGAAQDSSANDTMIGGLGGDYFYLCAARETLRFQVGEVGAGDMDYVVGVMNTYDRVEIASTLRTSVTVVASSGGALLSGNAPGGGTWSVFFLNETVASVNSHLYTLI